MSEEAPVRAPQKDVTRFPDSSHAELAPAGAGADLAPPDSETLMGMRNVLGAVAPMIQSLGEFMTSVGALESRIGMPMPKFFERSFSKDTISVFVTKAPPELVGQLFKVLLGFASLGSLDLNALSAEEKVTKGESLKGLADEVNALLTRLDQLPSPEESGK